MKTYHIVLITAVVILLPLSLALNYAYAYPALKSSFFEAKERYTVTQGPSTALAPGVEQAYATDTEALPQVRKITGGF